MGQVAGLVLAGGKGNRLSVLSWTRAKPALSFAGKYRLIDFTLTNCVDSGIYNVGIMVQHCPQSLQDHIRNGRPWELDRGELRFLHPLSGGGRPGLYRGTADAVYQNLALIERSGAELVLILSGDHIYQMDYNEMIRSHRAVGAAVTVGVTPVLLKEAPRFGVLSLDRAGRVVDFAEKPSHPRSNLASMGIYVFWSKILMEVLEEDAARPDSGHDFGRDILPQMLSRYPVAGYLYDGFWRDVGTVESYWEVNMELFTSSPLQNLFYGDKRVRTRHEDFPPARLGPRAQMCQSILCNGCHIEGSVCHSVLSRGVKVAEGAEVVDSVLLENVVVGRGARVERAIVDERVVIGEGAVVGHGRDDIPNADEPQILNCGITVVGKEALIPAGLKVGRNCRIAPCSQPQHFPSLDFLPSGCSVQPQAVPACS